MKKREEHIAFHRNYCRHYEKAMSRMLVVGPVISAWRIKPKPKTDRSDVLECPKCKGRLHVMQAAYNGHVRAKCETEGCVSFME